MCYASWCKVFSHEQRPVYKDFRWGQWGYNEKSFYGLLPLKIALWDSGVCLGLNKPRGHWPHLTMVSKWHKLKYDSQPYLCTSLGRLIAMTLNHHNASRLNVAKTIDDICARFLEKHWFCERRDDPLVLQDPKTRQQRVANRIWQHRTSKGWVLKPMQLEESSGWYEAVGLLKAIALHPDPRVVFRDSKSQFGKGRAANFANCVMARARQKVFTFDKTKPERASRIVLGWESMLLGGHPDQALQNIACNMCPVPVYNAIFLATLESVGEILAKADDAANSFGADDGDESHTEA